MKPLKQALKDYLRIRRSLGFQLREAEGLLRNFVAFLQAKGAPYITSELALRWATQPAKAQPSTLAERLGIGVSPSGTAPPNLAPRFHPQDFSRIVTAASLRTSTATKRLKGSFAKRNNSPLPRDSAPYTTLFGLLIATGMRVNEALGLDRPDVDLKLGILHIRRAKFGKSRYVPVHPSTVEALKKYAEVRDHLFPTPLLPAFFISEKCRRITEWIARYTFAKISQRIGLRASAKGHGRGPRLQDMRHHFAARTLIHWYRAGLDVERELPKLSTYLGHVHVNDTYWYLEAVPELLQLATDRLIHREVRP